MSDRMESFEQRSLPTRREFTLDAALAVLAGCVVTISDGLRQEFDQPIELRSNCKALRQLDARSWESSERNGLRAARPMIDKIRTVSKSSGRGGVSTSLR